MNLGFSLVEGEVQERQTRKMDQHQPSKNSIDLRLLDYLVRFQRFDFSCQLSLFGAIQLVGRLSLTIYLASIVAVENPLDLDLSSITLVFVTPMIAFLPVFISIAEFASISQNIDVVTQGLQFGWIFQSIGDLNNRPVLFVCLGSNYNFHWSRH